MLNFEYFKILMFFFISLIFVSVLIFISLILNKNVFSTSSFKPVECGSHSFGSGKNKIEINFYVIAILFVVFDTELVVVLPSLFFLEMSYKFSLVVVVSFLLMLVVGLIFEYCKGVFSLEITDLKNSDNNYYKYLDLESDLYYMIFNE